MSGGVVTNNGIAIIMQNAFLAAPTYSKSTLFTVGVGTTAAAISDTALEAPVPIYGTEQVDSCDVADWTDSADTTTTVNSSIFKEGTGALNFTKDGSASATAYTYKTTTSLDFTNKRLAIWIYIVDTATLNKLTVTAGLSIRYGNDSSNYWEWEFNRAELAVGWNRLDDMRSTNADNTQGSPALATCDYTYVEFVAVSAATVWSAGDIVFDDIKLISNDDYTKIFESGYPTVNETAKQVTVRTRLSTVDSNGYFITEHGLLNTDVSALLMARDTFTGYSKTNTDELIFSEKIFFDNE